MIWDGLEVMPVVSDDLTLEGLITRQDVMKAMQLVQRQPQIADTISDQISGGIQTIDRDRDGNLLANPKFKFMVTPQMVNGVGTISFGVLSEILSDVAQKTMVLNQRRNIMIEQMNLHYLRLIQLESELDIRPRVLEIGRRSAKLDIEVYIEKYDRFQGNRCLPSNGTFIESREIMTVQSEILAEIKTYDRIIIHRHQRPDPDALGSQVGLAEILRATFPQKRNLPSRGNCGGLALFSRNANS